MSADRSPGAPIPSPDGLHPPAYKAGLLAIACVALLFAFARIAIDTWQMWDTTERAVDSTALGLLAAAALSFVLLRVGPLTRVKWGDAEAEFSSLTATVKNTAELTSKDLAARVDELRSSLSETLGAGDEKMRAHLLAEAAPLEPPALKRPIEYPNDLWKGRFGGKASNGDYTLTAAFRTTPNSPAVEVSLKVKAASTKTPRTVEFFVHPTFPRERVKVRMVEGKAELDLLAWGGFTAGVWIAEDGVELELDLAEIAGAPKIIRDD